MEDKVLVIPEGLDGLRADSGLSQLLGMSRNQISALIEKKHIKIANVIITKSSRLGAGQLLEVHFPLDESLPSEPERIVEGMNILYQDEDIVVVDKPAGIAAHPSLGWYGDTVLGGLRAADFHITKYGPIERQGIVHRLDVGTSGVMVVALSDQAYVHLKHAFKYRLVTKEYHALVQGHPDPFSGTIDTPIIKTRGNEWKFTIHPEGKRAITHYDTVEAYRRATLLKVHLETGRTHQIRVHLSALGHPCLGDALYGADKRLSVKLHLGRQWLHASCLAFEHPRTHNIIQFESPFPPDIQAAMELVSEQ